MEMRVPDLSGKVAWVTGAGSGIGEAGALALGFLRDQVEHRRVAGGSRSLGGRHGVTVTPGFPRRLWGV